MKAEDDIAPGEARPPAGQAPGSSSSTSGAHARTGSAVSFQPSRITHDDAFHDPARRGSGNSSANPPTKAGGDARSGGGGGRWLRKMTSWLAAAEPSTRALEHHRKDVLRKAGVGPGDDDGEDARLKLQVPAGEIPPDAVRPAGKGSDPEDALRRRKAEEKRRREGSGSVLGPAVSQSSSSRSSKTRGENPVFPFD